MDASDRTKLLGTRRAHIVWKESGVRFPRTACGWDVDFLPSPRLYTISLDDNDRADWDALQVVKFREDPNACRTCLRILQDKCWG